MLIAETVASEQRNPIFAHSFALAFVLFNAAVIAAGMWGGAAEAAMQDCSTPTSPCVSFGTAPLCPDPEAPSLTAPPNGITLASPVTFTWTAVPGATSYTVYAGVNGATPLPSGTTGETNLIAPLGNGSVSWFVVATTGAFCPSLASQNGSFTLCSSAAPPVPDVISIATSGQLYMLQWNAIAGASSYQVDEATNDDFSDAITHTVNGTSINFQHAAPTGALPFYYRLRSVSSCGSAVSGNSSVARVVVTPIPKSAAPSAKSMGLANVHDARVTVRVVDGDGKVTAYGPVIDMKTQDPTYVPAQQSQ